MYLKKTVILFALLMLLAGCKTTHIFSSENDVGPQDTSNHLKRITFAEADNGTQVKLYGSRPFQYTTYKLSDPLRLAIELPSVTLDFKPRKMFLKDKNVAAISVVTFHKVNSVRVEIELYADSPFMINKKKNYLEVMIAATSSTAIGRAISEPVQKYKGSADISSASGEQLADEKIELNRKLLESKQTILNLEEQNLLLKQQAEEAQKQLEETRSMTKTQQARILFMEDQLSQIETRLAEQSQMSNNKSSSAVIPVPVPVPVPYEPPELLELLSSDTAKTADENAGTKESLLETVDSWLESWNAEDIDAYSSFYSDRFKSSKGRGKAEFIKKKTATFALRGMPSIVIERVELGLDGDMAQVSFLQKYSSKTLKSTVWKQLTLTMEGNEWKIITEIWSSKRLPVY